MSSVLGEVGTAVVGQPFDGMRNLGGSDVRSGRGPSESKRLSRALNPLMVNENARKTAKGRRGQKGIGQ
jgi:hypothetical protein